MVGEIILVVVWWATPILIALTIMAVRYGK